MNDGPDDAKPRDEEPREAGAETGQGILGLWRSLTGGKNDGESLRTTIEELIEQEDASLSDNPEEIALLRNVLRVRDVNVYDVMVPRADIVAVEAETKLADVAKLMSESTHSRLPVYRNKLDDIVGMVRKPLFVAPSMPVLELLLQMRVQRMHMAFVVDEFGGIDGLVTIEDLVEEIVGEIQDEHDEEPGPGIVRRNAGVFDVDARLEIEDFENAAGPFLTDVERDEDIDTMGGLVFYLAGRVPGRGEVIRHESVEFEILEADPRRIRRLRASHLPNSSEE